MYKVIDNTQYNVDGISQITFEEFRSIHTQWTEERCKNIYEEITEKKIEVSPVKKKKEKIPTLINDDICDTKVEKEVKQSDVDNDKA